MKALEGLKAMAKAKPMAPSPMMMGDDEAAEGEDPMRERMLGHADSLIAALKTGDRETVADVLEDCMHGYSEGEE